uniref:Uncharacterized protein n=1 Tax=Arundo donax TaxID=35708 RepID=A0A0A8YSC6_ARUDO
MMPLIAASDLNYSMAGRRKPYLKSQCNQFFKLGLF